ncbi:T9SS type A sorting domain-containing protein, partial [uncultured Thiodictyon sp.]|uniref:T9SS type A sorting domain-containing protein n=1 Tax=uncultured Thiodictyon sp. TaxID=1846217 RepID=UPI0025D32225
MKRFFWVGAFSWLFLVACSYPFTVFAQDQSSAYPISGRNQTHHVAYDGANGAHWWKFDALGSEGITAALTGNFNTGIVYFELYDANGTRLAQTTVRDGFTELLSEQIGTAGTYYVKVSNYG